MEEAAFVISIVSVLLTAVLAGFGILFQWLVSKDTRQQGAEIRQDVGIFKSEASGLLGEIRGLTTQTRESQERQVETMLHALVDRTREVTTTGAAGVMERIDAIEAALREEREPSEEVTAELHQLRERVEALSLDIPEAMQRAQPVMRGRVRVVAVHVFPTAILPGENVEITVDCTGDVQGLVVACGVATPEELAWGSKRVIDRGREGVGAGHTFPSFRYPQDFPGATTEARGGYMVRGELRLSLDAYTPIIDTAFGQFRVA
jgi:hypothetical protein